MAVGLKKAEALALNYTSNTNLARFFALSPENQAALLHFATWRDNLQQRALKAFMAKPTHIVGYTPQLKMFVDLYVLNHQLCAAFCPI